MKPLSGVRCHCSPRGEAAERSACPQHGRVRFMEALSITFRLHQLTKYLVQCKHYYRARFLNPLYLSKEAFFEGLGLYVSPGTSLCLCHCSPRGEATDFACWIISLRLAADAAENCYRMNSAVPKLGSKDSSTEHPCSRLHQLTNRVQALLPAQFA